MTAPEAAAVVMPVEDDEAEPCNYSAPEHDDEPTHYFAPGWRCTLHPPGAISQRHDQAGAS